MRKEIFRRVADSIRYRLPVPYEGKVMAINDDDSGRTGFYRVTVDVSRRRQITLKDVRGFYLAGVEIGDLVKVSREEVIFGEPTIEKIEKQKE